MPRSIHATPKWYKIVHQNQAVVKEAEARKNSKDNTVTILITLYHLISFMEKMEEENEGKKYYP